MTTFSWRGFLKNYSLEWLKQDADVLGDDITPDMIRKGWIGYEPASDTQIEALEARLGKSLPPSYTDFLRVSNGWTALTPFIQRVFNTEQVQWFNTLNAEWVHEFLEGMGFHAEQDDWADEVLSEMPERHLSDTLQISAPHDGAVLLLNPQVRDQNGEWEAWFFANWNPGATVYPSFQALIEAQYKTFMTLSQKDQRRYRRDDDLRAQLGYLRQEIRDRLLERERLSVLDFGISDTARGVLHDVMKRVEHIQQSATTPEEALQLLRELQRECASKAQETPPHVDTTEMLAVLSPQDTQEMVNKISELAPNLHAHGKQQGYQTAYNAIKWFLREG
jgi:hypothetical protein